MFKLSPSEMRIREVGESLKTTKIIARKVMMDIQGSEFVNAIVPG